MMPTRAMMPTRSTVSIILILLLAPLAGCAGKNPANPITTASTLPTSPSIVSQTVSYDATTGMRGCVLAVVTLLCPIAQNGQGDLHEFTCARGVPVGITGNAS